MNKQTLEKLVVTMLILIYIIFGDQTPKWVAMFVYSGFGVLLLMVLCGYYLIVKNYYLASLFIVFSGVLLYRVSQYNFPISTQREKDIKLMSYNQTPYTLEQEIVQLRLPSSDFNATPESFGFGFKPSVDNTHNASAV